MRVLPQGTPRPASWRGIAAASLILLAACTAPPAGRPEVMVYAAISLRAPLQALAAPCGDSAGARIAVNFGASDDLARQIEAAGRADLFLPADEATMDRLAAAGLIDEATRRPLLSNRLVVVVPADAPDGVSALTSPATQRISLADPLSVPAGRYAKAWLVKAGIWDQVKDRIVPALDARAALAAVESGGAQAGVVYRTDAALSDRVRVVREVDETEGPVISYPIAALKGRPHPEAARRVIDCLEGPGGMAAFRDAGFIVKPPPAPGG